MILVELFTSEGCSSCPPAERWMNGLKSDPSLWTDFVPLAFHVDYWDYIGWEDRFARAEFSERQRAYAAWRRLSTVYTPGVVRDGREWLGWRRGESVRADAPSPGRLSVELEADIAAIRFVPAGENDHELVAHVAVLGMGLASKVTAGENRGKTLPHDFVVLDLVSVPLSRGPAGLHATVPLDGIIPGVEGRAIAAWVSRADDPAPIQATGGHL